MCTAGQAGAATPERGSGTSRSMERSAEAAMPCSGVGKVPLDTASRVGTTTPGSHTPRSDTSLPSLALAGTAAASGESDFVETPRAEVGVPPAEWCWQPCAVPDAGVPTLAEWCWQPTGAFFQQPAGQPGEWQHGQQQAQVAQAFAQSWLVQPAFARLPHEHDQLYVALSGQDPFAAQQFMAFDWAAAAPARSKGKGTTGKGKGTGRGGSTSAQGGQQCRRDARSGKGPSPPPVLGAADLEADDALAAVLGQALQLSFDKTGTRMVQKALGVADRKKQGALLEELSGHMLEMMECPHANYVAQEIFKVVPAERLGAVIKEFEGRAERCARHRYGCRIIIQLFAHCFKRPESAGLVDELLNRADDLCHHQYAHHVIEAILEHTDDDQHKHRVFCALSANLLGFAQDHHGSHLLRAAITHCSDADVGSLCASLTGRILEVTATKIGCHLYKDLCRHPRVRQEAGAALARHAAPLRGRTESRRLVAVGGRS